MDSNNQSDCSRTGNSRTNDKSCIFIRDEVHAKGVCYFIVNYYTSSSKLPQTTNFILHTQIEDRERKTPIDFGVKMSKVKVIVTCPPAGPSLTVSVF